MAGTKAGAAKTRETNIRKYGADYYQRMGKVGGAAVHTKPRGFAWMKANGQVEKVSRAGTLGGSISRKPKKVASYDTSKNQ